jgi:hypothetical protein
MKPGMRHIQGDNRQRLEVTESRFGHVGEMEEVTGRDKLLI